MWKQAEYTGKPLEIDTVSSHTHVYIRKNIHHVDETEDQWQCVEQIIPLDEWEQYQFVNKDELQLLENAILELAELIG